MELLFYLLIQLVAIANACPLTDGDAVYEARGLVASMGIEVNEVANCNPTQPALRSSQSDTQGQQLTASIYPNPAKSVVFLPVDLIGARVQVLDQMGTIIIEREIASSSLDVAQLPSGTYTLRFFVSGKQPQNEKLVIIKD
jgi:hypothetical protein